MVHKTSLSPLPSNLVKKKQIKKTTTQNPITTNKEKNANKETKKE